MTDSIQRRNPRARSSGADRARPLSVAPRSVLGEQLTALSCAVRVTWSHTRASNERCQDSVSLGCELASGTVSFDAISPTMIAHFQVAVKLLKHRARGWLTKQHKPAIVYYVVAQWRPSPLIRPAAWPPATRVRWRQLPSRHSSLDEASAFLGCRDGTRLAGEATRAPSRNRIGASPAAVGLGRFVAQEDKCTPCAT